MCSYYQPLINKQFEAVKSTSFIKLTSSSVPLSSSKTSSIGSKCSSWTPSSKCISKFESFSRAYTLNVLRFGITDERLTTSADVWPSYAGALVILE